MTAIIVEHDISEGKYNFDGRCMFVPAAFNVKNLLKILSLSRKNGFASFFLPPIVNLIREKEEV